MSKKLNTDPVGVFFDYGVDVTNRTIYLGSASYGEEDQETGVDFLMAEKFIKGIYLLDKAAPYGDKPITVLMNNIGGEIWHGMAIYDAIKSCKNEVKIIAIGNAMSMGCVILQAGDKRLLTPNTVVMFHEGYTGHSVNHPKIISNWVKFEEKYSAEVLDKILLDKIQKHHPEFKEKKFKELNLFDTILRAKEAVELGLADGIIDTF